MQINMEYGLLWWVFMCFVCFIKFELSKSLVKDSDEESVSIINEWWRTERVKNEFQCFW